MKWLDTIIISVWHQDGKTAIFGSIRRQDGTTETGCIERIGSYLWEVLDNALNDAKAIKMKNLLILCNDKDAIAMFSGPVPPDKTRRMWIQHGKGRGNGEYKDIPYGGCQHMWSILYHTASYKRWKISESQKLEKAKELWSIWSGTPCLKAGACVS